MSSPADHPATIWLTPEQEPLARAVLARAGLMAVAVGSPSVGRGRGLAEAFGAKPLPDLRSALASAERGIVIIFAPGPFGASPDDADAFLDARERGVRLATLEPMPVSLAALATTSAAADPRSAGTPLVAVGDPSLALTNFASLRSAQAEWAAFCPLTRLARSSQEALEIIPQFGPVRSAAIECVSGPLEGSLGARLFDAMDLALAFLGEPETIDASYAAPGAGPGVHAVPGESIHGLSGDITANVRFAGGRSASVLVSDQAGRFSRRITLIGQRGRVRLAEDSFEWLDTTGRLVDESRPKRPRKPRSALKALADAAAATAPAPAAAPAATGAPVLPDSPFIALLADQLKRIIETGARGGDPTFTVDYPRVLAMAQAALLSARTGEGESPATMLRISGV